MSGDVKETMTTFSTLQLTNRFARQARKTRGNRSWGRPMWSLGQAQKSDSGVKRNEASQLLEQVEAYKPDVQKFSDRLDLDSMYWCGGSGEDSGVGLCFRT